MNLLIVDTFTALTPWLGDLVCAEGAYPEGETDKRAAHLRADGPQERRPPHGR